MERYETVAQSSGVVQKTIRRWVSDCDGLDSTDWLVALAPKYKREREAAEFSADARDYIEHEYFTLGKRALKPIYRKAVRIGSVHDWIIPSYDSVARWIKSFPRSHHVLTREGADALDKLVPSIERVYDLRLHDIWESDGRRNDVFCIWPDGEIGRPHVVVWRDIQSRLVLGRAVGKVESADLVLRAFRNSAQVIGAVPHEALLDNGRAYASKLLTGKQPTRYRFKVRDQDIPGVLTLLGIKVHWATPYRGQVKPVESFWREIAENVDKTFPGAYCGNRPDAKPEDFDSRKAIPIAQFVKTLDDALADFNARPHRGNGMKNRSPAQVYAELLPQTEIRKPTARQLDICLLGAESMKLSSEDRHVRLLGNRYWCERLMELRSNGPYTVRFDPDNASANVLLYDGDRFVCEVPLVERCGFRSLEAARENIRAKKRIIKRRKEIARDEQKRLESRRWLQVSDSAPIDPAIPALRTRRPRVVALVKQPFELPQIQQTEQRISQEEMEKRISAGCARRRVQRDFRDAWAE